MRTLEELLENNIQRIDMTHEEELLFVDYCYDFYEKGGFKDTFTSPFELYPEQKQHENQKFQVIKRCIPNKDFDIDSLPMWKIKFEDGYEMEAYPEEITKTEEN